MLQARRVSAAALLLVPGALVLYFAFNSGGFYPGPPAYAAVILWLALLIRLAMATSPFAGLSWQLILGGGALLALALLTLLSGAWSHAPGVARTEFDLPLLYLLAMLLFGLIGRTRTRLRWMLRALAAASFIVSTCGLITRLLPHLWPTSPEIANNRLSFPVTYWNVLGLLAAIGLVLCVHLCSDLRERWPGRVLAAGAVPVMATTILFTFSRGAIAACIVGLVAYVVLGRPRGLLSAFVSIAPATAIALKVAYDANLLATPNPTTAAAVVQGRHVAVVVGVCALASLLVRFGCAVGLDPRLRRFSIGLDLGPLRGWRGWVAAGAAPAVVIALLAFNGTLGREYHRFVHPTSTNPADLRARLTDPANNGRIGYWQVAWRGFRSAPAAGQGAGTYSDTWAQHRTAAFAVQDAHSLYLETLDELGIVGLALLLVTIVTILARVAARARGSGRSLYAAVFAVLLAWALHAGVDWDWEMPVVTIVFFALGGFALGRRVKRVDLARTAEGATSARVTISQTGRGTPTTRVLVGLALIPLFVLPAYVWLSERRLEDANYAFSQGDCQAARKAALSSISILGNRAEPYEVLSYCESRLGDDRAAIAAIDKAISLDPGNWNYRYDASLVLAAGRRDPRPAASRALSLNPRGTLVQNAWRTFQSGNSAQWRRYAETQINSFSTL